MKIISHRGNKFGPSSLTTNDIIADLKLSNHDVELDIWKINNRFYISHDEPNTDNEINTFFLYDYKERLLIHAKNAECLEWLIEETNDRFHFFSHQKDDYAFTNRGYLIIYPGKQIIYGPRTIVMLPELGGKINGKIYAICTDYVENYIH